MKSIRLILSTLAAGALLASLRAEPTVSTIKFSDPAKPGRLEIRLARGDLRIQGTETTEVTVKSEAKPAAQTPRKDGLRVISATSSFSLTEKDNLAVLDATADGWGGKSGADFALTVPRHTAVVVQNSWGGDITCTGLAGNLEINSMNGQIRLDEITGGVVVSTMNGEIRANIRELREGSPLSFTSMNGEVVLRVPADAKASVRLRTQNGSVLTDFDETALITKTESTPGSRTRTVTVNGNGAKVLSDDVREKIRSAAHIGIHAAHEAIAAVKESFTAAREGAQEAKRESEQAKESANRSGQNAPPPPVVPPVPAASPRPPAPPKISLPTISGGKLVTGTLNGGGPEISVSTMNGDVTLRKQETKP